MDSKTFNAQMSASEAGKLVLEAIERLPDGLSIFGPNFEVICANRKSLSRFGLTYSMLAAGSSMKDTMRASVRKSMPKFTDAEVEATTSHIYQAMLAGVPIDLLTDDGRVVQVTYEQLTEGRRVAISVDITELRNREKELKAARKSADDANASKSTFLANTSHEIRTPLNAILGLAQVLSKYDLPAEVRDHVASILDAGKTLTALLNDVLDLSKIEAGKLDMAPVDADLAHAMRRILRLWRPRAEEKGLDLSLSIDADLPPMLHFDPTRVRQCVSNLVSNAIKFTRQGQIDVAIRSRRTREGNFAIAVIVKDSGIGIDAEAQSRLFKPFVQADASTSRHFGGTGLGLAITRKLAQQMGGDVAMTSAPGAGSTFTFTFIAEAPKAPAQERNETSGAESTAVSRFAGLRVLIVDDIPINRQVAALFLRPLGCVTAEAENGAAALEILASGETFDVVLLDVHMPVMDGIATIREIRAPGFSHREIKVIALTADAMSGDRERYLALGMNGYISKPINEGEMTAEILRVLADAPLAAVPVQKRA